MSAFIKDNFVKSGDYIHYENKFVARFKYGRGGAGTFLTFLRKNFTVEEYFEKTSGGGIENTPLKVLQAKGYLQPHIKKELKQRGLPLNQEGYKMMIDEDVKNWDIAINAQKETK